MKNGLLFLKVLFVFSLPVFVIACTGARFGDVGLTNSLVDKIKNDAVEREFFDGRHMFINEAVYFDFESTVLSKNARMLLEQKVMWFTENSTENLVLEGNCDMRGSDAYNFVLGERRGNVVKNFIVALGIDENRISVISRGENNLVDCGRSEECMAKNRRVCFFIVE